MDKKMYAIKQLCLNEKSKNPLDIVNKLMHLPELPIHGPEHHIIDGAAFLTAMHNAGANFDLSEALDEIENRGKKMPGATCGQWGICGSSASVGAALAIINGTGPLSNGENYSNNLRLTSLALGRIAEIGGPRCCKRNAYISLQTAIEFVNDKYNIHLENKTVSCEFSPLNKQCIKNKCPYYNGDASEK